MEGRNLVDVSSFFLFESTGDSEVVDSLIEDVDEGKVDEDAQSFCCDSSECARFDDFQDFDHYHEDISFYDNQHHGKDDDDEVEDEDAIDQEWSCGKAMLGQHKKSMVYHDDDDDSNVVEQMNKRREDNDRHFWEACLTSWLFYFNF